MNTREFSDRMDTLLNSYSVNPQFGEDSSKGEITLNEYEKSVYLSDAVKQFVIGYYTGKNEYNFSFEEKEIIREAIDTLVKTVILEEMPDSSVPEGLKHLNKGKCVFAFYKIPDNLLYTIFEEINFSSYISDCNNGRAALVIPSTHDELWHRLNNPFRGPSKNRVLRLNAADNIVELVSDYPIGSYLLRYVEEPKPIILIDLPDGLTIDGLSKRTECELPDITHPVILNIAVNLALRSKVIGASTSSKSKD